MLVCRVDVYFYALYYKDNSVNMTQSNVTCECKAENQIKVSHLMLHFLSRLPWK